MLRMLLVLEDYSELMFLQTVFKKTGFDVDGIQNVRSFEEGLLRMNPEVLVMTAYGKRVKGFELAKLVKKVRGMPHIILLYSPGQMREQDPSIDHWVPAPVSAPDLLDAIADVCKLNKQVLRDKLQRLKLDELQGDSASRAAKPESELVYGSQGPNAEDDITQKISTAPSANEEAQVTLKPSAMSSSEREARFAKFLKKSPPSEAGKAGFSVQQVKEQVKALRGQAETPATQDLERERQAFVEFLFNAKKKSG